MIFRPGFAIRRLVMALAALQLTVTIAVPLAEARAERAPGPVSLERQHTDECVTIHRPSACVLCQHAATRTHPARAASIPEAPSVIGHATERSVTTCTSFNAPVQPPTRGPPPPLG